MIESPAAVFSAEGLKILLSAVKSGDISELLGSTTEANAVDALVDAYCSRKNTKRGTTVKSEGGKTRTQEVKERDRDAVLQLLQVHEVLSMADIKHRLRDEFGIEWKNGSSPRFMDQIIRDSQMPIVKLPNGMFSIESQNKLATGEDV